MYARILSQVVTRAMTIAGMAIAISIYCSEVGAQSGAGYYTDPATGIVYQQVTRTVERPVMETKVESREQTVYRPQTVTETKPQTRTVYTPVIEHQWEPRLHGRWNPFRSPTVAYHHVPRTHWEQRNDVVQHTTTRTEWVAERRTVDVPQSIVRIEREQKVDFEPVGRVSPQQVNPPGASEAIASRLRPLSSDSQIAPFGQSLIATNAVGRMTSDPPRRTAGQSGIRSTNLYPSSPSVYSQALPPVSSGGVGIANIRPLPIFR